VSNPPYIEAGTIDRLMPEVARYEPRLALDGGPDGLAPYRSIAAASPRLVTAGGHLVVEIGEGQAIEIAGIFESAGFRTAAPVRDLGGIERVLRATH
jgi:release factor glutamine methyltransferase